MTAEEMIAIKHKISLEATGMTVEERRVSYSSGAAEVQKKIDALRAERNETPKPTPIIRRK